jgi:hypothetical protein
MESMWDSCPSKLFAIRKMSDDLPLEKARPKKIPKMLMEMTTSMLAAPTMRVGIPLSTPYPLSWRLRVVGITTEGEHAATVYLYEGEEEEEKGAEETRPERD